MNLPTPANAIWVLLVVTLLSGCLAPDALLRGGGGGFASGDDRLSRLDTEVPPSAPAPSVYRSLSPEPRRGRKLLVSGAVLTAIGGSFIIGGGAAFGWPCHDTGPFGCFGQFIGGMTLASVGASLFVPGVIMLGVGGYRYNNPAH